MTLSPTEAVYINLGFWGFVLVVIGLLLWWQRQKVRTLRRQAPWSALYADRPQGEALKAVIRQAVDEGRLSDAEAMLDAAENGSPVVFPPEVELPEGAAPGLPGEFLVPEVPTGLRDRPSVDRELLRHVLGGGEPAK